MNNEGANCLQFCKAGQYYSGEIMTDLDALDAAVEAIVNVGAEIRNLSKSGFFVVILFR
jgi:hypothetical protein